MWIGKYWIHSNLRPPQQQAWISGCISLTSDVQGEEQCSLYWSGFFWLLETKLVFHVYEKYFKKNSKNLYLDIIILDAQNKSWTKPVEAISTGFVLKKVVYFADQGGRKGTTPSQNSAKKRHIQLLLFKSLPLRRTLVTMASSWAAIAVRWVPSSRSWPSAMA